MIGLDFNITNKAVTQHDVFLFKGMSWFSGEHVAIGDDGLYTLFDSQLYDVDTGIASYFIVHFTLGISCRLRYIIIGGEFSGTMAMTLTGDESNECSYTLTPKNTSNYQHTFRVPIRRENKRNTWWKLKLANVSGSDYSVDTISVIPVYQEQYYV